MVPACGSGSNGVGRARNRRMPCLPWGIPGRVAGPLPGSMSIPAAETSRLWLSAGLGGVRPPQHGPTRCDPCTRSSGCRRRAHACDACDACGRIVCSCTTWRMHLPRGVCVLHARCAGKAERNTHTHTHASRFQVHAPGHASLLLGRDQRGGQGGNARPPPQTGRREQWILHHPAAPLLSQSIHSAKLEARCVGGRGEGGGMNGRRATR
jgi:hypothetical protein